MEKNSNVLLGVLAIILGLLVMTFPIFSVFTASVLAGFAIVFLGIWLLVQSFGLWGGSKAASIGYFIFGLLAIIVGIVLFGSVIAFSILASFWLYFAGFFLIISGIMSFFTKGGTTGKGIGAIGVIMGILYILLASFAWDPYYLALIIGLWLIFDGVALFFISPSDLVKTV